MLIDLHVHKHGYLEVYPPYLVRRETLVGTGQLPKFADDAFAIEITGEFRVIPPVEPWNCASPKLNTPPSAATNQ